MGVDRPIAVLGSLRKKRLNPWTILAGSFVPLGFVTWLAAFDPSAQVRIIGIGTIILLLSSVYLSIRTMNVMLLALLISVITVVSVRGVKGNLTYTGAATIGVASAVSWLQVRRRQRLGLKHVRAETVIELIRDRLELQAQLPDIPPGWSIEVERRAANQAAISGDFVACRLTGPETAQVLHLAVVDVTGSGIDAGPPALLLSGAVGGLLGTVDPDEFLLAANDYLARQAWNLGFASAMYISVELASGNYEIRVAGHPPPMHYRATQVAGSCRWRQSSASGTLLGVLPTPSLVTDRGVLLPGDALIGFTDGLVEDRSQDLDAGVARLQQQVETLVENGNWTGAAKELVDRVPFKAHDDRTAVIIRRDRVPSTSTARQHRDQGVISQFPVRSSQAA
jgi:serine phosphatase RsbU (regulator of sigma subunit)